MQDRATENSAVVVESGKEPFLMSAVLSGGASAQNHLGKRIAQRRRSEDSGESSSEPRSISPMDLTSKNNLSSSASSSSGMESPQDLSSSSSSARIIQHVHHREENVKRRRLDDILHRKFPPSSSSNNDNNISSANTAIHTPLSSRKRKHPTESIPSGILSEEEEDATIRAGRFIQIAALLNSDVFKNNPLLYYGYYAQLIQSLRRSGEEEEEEKKSKIRRVNINNNTGDLTPTPFRGYTSPEARQKTTSKSFNLSSLLSTPSSPSSANSSPVTQHKITDITPPSYPEPASSPASSPDDEQPSRHKRAPRALTGRHVRPGTGASPRTLALLRQKIQERLRLRGESESHQSLNCSSGRKPSKKSKKNSN